MRDTLHIPQLYASAITGQSAPCDMVPLAAAFADAWMALLGADADEMYCDARLTAAAQMQAEWLAVNDFTPGDAHRGQGGSYANQRVRAMGYRLPKWYPIESNQVESAARTWGTPAEAAQALADHDTHRDHMHRRGWFSSHVVWGVGAAEATIDRGGVFYIAISAPIEA